MGIPIDKFNNIVLNIYTVFISLALFFHVFNKIEVVSGVKLFYIPSLLSALLGFYIIGKHSKLFASVFMFTLFTGISALLSMSASAMMNAVVMMSVIYASFGLKFVDLDKFLSLNILLVVFSVAWLFLSYWREPVYRFSGYYNDPNYLCTTLLYFLYVLLLSIKKFRNIVIRIIGFITIVLLSFIVLFTVSRTGIMCLVFILLASIFHWIKKYTLLAFCSFCLFGIVCVNIFSSYFSDVLVVLEQRLNNDDNLSEASDLRMELSLQGIEYVASNPILLMTGIGIGETEKEEAIPFRKDYHRDHNTVTSCLTEQGIFSFIFYALLLWQIWMYLLVNNHINNGNKALKVISFLSLGLFSLSIWQMTYLPYWGLLFLLANDKASLVN